jgi:hypothetical protein
MKKGQEVIIPREDPQDRQDLGNINDFFKNRFLRPGMVAYACNST